MSKKIEENPEFLKKVAPIRFLVLDVDGVMTDGKIGYTSAGDECKSFDAKDGVGIKYWIRAGHRAGIITGRSSPAVARRAEELGVGFVAQNAREKLPVFEKMLADAGVSAGETAVMGDDLADIPLIRRAGVGIAVADAVAETKDAALWTTEKTGGNGAVREVIEAILKAQDRWTVILSRYC
ncbi:MAG: HAD hydrolase family protein [Planctomycetota bacterium]|jgi:3-deoxy-D-manno-octulosonate 8-phosphate phosphatase (KDO 8-P phosphatase)|nr:HAD hydrolase family protein [Planctomycetota bacterium]